MSSSADSRLQVFEVTWKVPNFLRCKLGKREGFRKTLNIGETVSPADLRKLDIFPTKLEVKIDVESQRTQAASTWDINFTYFEWSQGTKIPSCYIAQAELLELKTMSGSNTLEDLLIGNQSIMNFQMDTSHRRMPFKASDAKHHVDKSDGCLTIYFKLQVTSYPSYKLQLASKNSASNLEELSTDFGSLLKDPSSGDVEIKVTTGKGQTFHCHKAILAARSEVFRAMFQSEMKETKEGVVEVDDISPKTMEHFLSFLYSGRFNENDVTWIHSLPQLAYAADKYGVKSLKKICEENLIRSVTPRNALAVCKLAERHGLTKAAKDIREFIAENVFELTVDTEVDTSEPCDPSDPNFVVSYSYGAP